VEVGDEATASALRRERVRRRIMDYQGVSFPLADSAADAAPGRLLALEVARMVAAGADPKRVVRAPTCGGDLDQPAGLHRVDMG
jgi:alkylation response protein AidB-like acyl-CoA dehydrogenase